MKAQTQSRNGTGQMIAGLGCLLDAESQLVFQLAQSAATTPSSPDLNSIKDWGRVLYLAMEENAIIALRDHLTTAPSHCIPAEIRWHIAMLALDREFRMRLLERRLEESLASLNAAGVEVILLKGSALACTVYGSFRARLMRDVDLLVKPERADETKALMLNMGWGVDELANDQSYGAHHHLSPLRDLAGSGLRMEIHRDLANLGHPFRFGDEIWEAARAVKVGAADALVMHPVHHAVHLTIHFAWSHMLQMGAWHAFRDLATLTTTGLLDWEEFARTSRRWRACSCGFWTLQLASLLSGLPVANYILKSLRPRIPDAMFRPLMRHFLNNVLRREAGCPSVRLEQLLWAAAMLPHRAGHRPTRPWSVSKDLDSARKVSDSPFHERFGTSRLRQARRTARYLSQILA